jgi:hypothetical protein
MTRRIDQGTVVNSIGFGTVAAPSAPFSVQVPAKASPGALCADDDAPAPLTERIIESTRHLRGLLPEDEMQTIHENLADKLAGDPLFLDLVRDGRSEAKVCANDGGEGQEGT